MGKESPAEFLTCCCFGICLSMCHCRLVKGWMCLLKYVHIVLVVAVTVCVAGCWGKLWILIQSVNYTEQWTAENLRHEVLPWVELCCKAGRGMQGSFDFLGSTMLLRNVMFSWCWIIPSAYPAHSQRIWKETQGWSRVETRKEKFYCRCISIQIKYMWNSFYASLQMLCKC